MVGDGAHHGTFEIEVHLFLAGKFDGFQYQQRTGTGVLKLQRVAGNEVIHQFVVPCEEGGGVGVVVGIFDGDDSALVETMEFALEDEEELAGIGNCLSLLRHAGGMETVEVLGGHAIVGMQGEGFLELAFLVFGEASDERVEVAEVVDAIGDTLARLEAKRLHRLHAEGLGGVLLVVVSKVKAV